MKRLLRFAISCAIAFAVLLSGGACARAGDPIPRDLLIEDVRQLASIIEDSHPEPYLRGGGRVPFNRLLQQTLASIPDEGMTVPEFFRVLSPLVAHVRDAHTALDGQLSYDQHSPGGVPLYFAQVEGGLWVRGVTDEAHRDLIGAALVSVEGVTLRELVERVKHLRGADNDYTALSSLGTTGYLWSAGRLAELVPEWKDRSRIRAHLEMPSGEVVEREFDVPVEMDFPLKGPETSVDLPSTDRCDFVYGFLDDDEEVAILRIDGMTGFREDFELEGTSTSMEGLCYAWERCHGTPCPDDASEAIAGIPSATETFRSLVKDMRTRGTDALIVDLRRNGGGNSLMQDMLLYFLFGKDAYFWVKGLTATDVVKLSDLYFETRTHASFEQADAAVGFPLEESDYDFQFDCTDQPDKLAALDVRGLMESYLALMPTFFEEYETGTYAGHYCPEKIVVLCSDRTFSGGFTLMWCLHKFGATIVGTPSAQAGNGFMDGLAFTLTNSGLQGQVSSKQVSYFPGDAERGEVLRPDIELTYDYLSSKDFDRNVTVLLALEKLPGIKPVDPLRHHNSHPEPRSTPTR